jgi:hypothetical protein
VRGKGVGILDKLLRKFSRRFIYERKAPRRRPANLQTRFRVRAGTRASEYIEARTRDLSASGLAIESSTMRVAGLHLYDSPDMVTPTLLDIVLGLPSGDVTIVGETVRYDALPSGSYLVGVHIVEMSETDRERYDAFVATLKDR